MTLTPPPKKYGVTHWSSRLLADHLGIGYGTVARVWREHGVQPWRAETSKFSTDPELVAKVTDIVGLYLEPPQGAVVLCVDKKLQIQALDRTAPTLPMQIGIPERQDPRLHPARHHVAVRGSRGRDRQGDWSVQTPTSSPGISCVPQARRACLSRSRAPSGDGQLCCAQKTGSPRLADRKPQDQNAFHTDLGVVDEPGRGVVRHHRTPRPSIGVPSAVSATSPPQSASSLTAGTPARSHSCQPKPPTKSSARPTAQQLQTRTTTRNRRIQTPTTPSIMKSR